jgi:hypothetical protein
MDRSDADEPTTAERTTAPAASRTGYDGDDDLVATRSRTASGTPVAPQPDTPTRVDETR